MAAVAEGVTYVSPRWDERNLRRASPTSCRAIEWGFRHSASKSCVVQVSSLKRWRGCDCAPYSDIEILELDNPSEEGDPLAEVGKLPHIPDALQHRRLFGGFDIAAVNLVQGPLPRRRHIGGRGIRRGMLPQRTGRKGRGLE